MMQEIQQEGSLLLAMEARKDSRMAGQSMRTCLRLIPKARVSTPSTSNEGTLGREIRSGFEIEDGEVLAAWINQRHPADYRSRYQRAGVDKNEWNRVPLISNSVRRLLHHVVDLQRAEPTVGVPNTAPLLREY